MENALRSLPRLGQGKLEHHATFFRGYKDTNVKVNSSLRDFYGPPLTNDGTEQTFVTEKRSKSHSHFSPSP